MSVSGSPRCGNHLQVLIAAAASKRDDADAAYGIFYDPKAVEK
jgi:hypothetical protein